MNSYTVAAANALLDRMAFRTPWHTGYCAACPCAVRGIHGTRGLLTGEDYGPCPLLPIPNGTFDVDAALRAKVARVEWSGAGCCLACHAMLPLPREGDEGVIENPRQYHRDRCEVVAILRDFA